MIFKIRKLTDQDLTPYYYQLNNYLAYDYFDKKILLKSNRFLIFLFAFLTIYKEILEGNLDDIKELLDKLKVDKKDILKGLRIDKDLNIYFSNSIRDKVYQIEYGKPGIINGTPATRLFLKFNAFMEIQFEELLKAGQF
jgi:hypothetical protein